MATATAYDPKSALLTQLGDVCKMYIADLSFIPSDKIAQSPMGKARTALEFTAECAGFNTLVAKIVRGEQPEMKSDEERQAHYASVNTVEKASSELQSSVDELVSAIEAATEDRLFSAATTPWEAETTVYRLAGMCHTHMVYHDGQLNYIQSLYGDGETHWG